MRRDLGDGPAHDVQLLVGFGGRVAAVEILRDEEMHALATEAGRRIERRRLAPAPTCEARLFLELPARTRERGLAGFQRSGRQLDELLQRGLATLAHEGDHPVTVD